MVPLPWLTRSCPEEVCGRVASYYCGILSQSQANLVPL